MLKLHYGMVCYVGGVAGGREWALVSGVTAQSN
jgi:hypothetical protein